MLRKKIIRTKIKEMEERLKIVEENLPSDSREFSNMGLTKDGIYKNIEFCIQQVIDICAVINSDLELGIPSDESEIIDNLMKDEILSEKIGGRIKRMKGFRNILVHRYGKIKDELAFESIKKGFKDFHRFIETIEGLLEEINSK